MKYIFIKTMFFILLGVSAAYAKEPSNHEVIQAQVAAAMASADYVTRKCPSLQIDKNKLTALIARSGMSSNQLKASEDYIDQRDVIQQLEKNQKSATICWALSQAHGGSTHGVIYQK